jgi:hypothetical protein
MTDATILHMGVLLACDRTRLVGNAGHRRANRNNLFDSGARHERAGGRVARCDRRSSIRGSTRLVALGARALQTCRERRRIHALACGAGVDDDLFKRLQPELELHGGTQRRDQRKPVQERISVLDRRSRSVSHHGRESRNRSLARLRPCDVPDAWRHGSRHDAAVERLVSVLAQSVAARDGATSRCAHPRRDGSQVTRRGA